MLEYPPVTTETEEAESWQMAFMPEMQRLNADYPYWDKVKYLSAPAHLSARQVWVALKVLRQFNRNIVQFGAYKFSFTVTDEMLELLHYFDMNIGGMLAGDQIIPTENRNTYLISSIMEEAIASSQMEGAATTREVAKHMLRKSEKPKTKGQQMILNNYLTINYIKEHAKDNFSIEHLKEIHRSMTAATLDNEEDAGALRGNDNIVVMNGITGDIAHRPPHYEEVEDLLLDLERFFNQNTGAFIHPIVKAIIVHFMLSYIHPFVDGNGRTARALFYWYMLRQGYWLIEYMSISRIIAKTKKAYEKAFLCTEYDDNDLTYFVLYNLRTMRKAFEELKLYLKRKTEENKSAVLLTTLRGINQRQAQILQIVMENPNSCFSVKEIQNRFAVSDYTARTDLETLVRFGYLAEIKMNKVKKGYVKSDRFDILIKDSLQKNS